MVTCACGVNEHATGKCRACLQSDYDDAIEQIAALEAENATLKAALEESKEEQKVATARRALGLEE